MEEAQTNGIFTAFHVVGGGSFHWEKSGRRKPLLSFLKPMTRDGEGMTMEKLGARENASYMRVTEQ